MSLKADSYILKAKITPELKKRFLEEIKRSIKTGKETGFPICLSNAKAQNDKLYAPAKRCTGKECEFIIEDLKKYCPDKVQGAFHPHPYLPNIERFYGRKPTEKEIKDGIKIYKRHFEKEGITLQTPSHHDLTDVLIDQCIGDTEGTVCVGSDMDLTKVECWTIKSDRVKIRDCPQATEEHKQRISDKPRDWIKPLFNREIINVQH